MTLTQLRASKSYITDKRSYLPFYDSLFAPLKDEPVRLLELGVAAGGSLELWRDYFVRAAQIAGIDEHQSIELGPGIQIYQHAITDEHTFRAFCRKTFAGSKFSIIIDDASHHASLTAVAFNVLFPEFLKFGGIYCIEDWLVGYWPNWVESAGGLQDPTRIGATATNGIFPSHQGGMAGLVKQLVDGLNWYAETGIAELRFVPGAVAVRKR